MNIRLRCLISAALLLAAVSACQAGDRPLANTANSAKSPAKAAALPAGPTYLLTNDDLGFPWGNQASIYLAGGTNTAPSLNFQGEALTNGLGVAGGFFAAQKINFVPGTSNQCAYVSNGLTNDIATLSAPGFELVDNFVGSDSDSGDSNGIGMALNNNYLYASYSTSNTVATFALQPGCALSFIGDVPAQGLHGGSVAGMAVNSKILVVAYGDGSIESFNVTAGMPVSNGDLQNGSGFLYGNMPSGVDISQDGRFAIFGDISPVATTVEVSNISSGKLTKTVVYTIGPSMSSGTIRLSPDQSLLYIANNEGGTVTAAFFNKATGSLSPGCVSPTLSGFNGRPFIGGIATRDTTGSGGALYVGEYGVPLGEGGVRSAIGILAVTEILNSNISKCTLTESVNSPVLSDKPGMMSLGVYPPRPF